jgi:hypothetical protein
VTCLMVCRCRTVVRKPQPEAVWNLLHLPTINNVVDSQRWQVSPLYFWFDECTCTKVRRSPTSTLVAAVRYSGIPSNLRTSCINLGQVTA